MDFKTDLFLAGGWGGNTKLVDLIWAPAFLLVGVHWVMLKLIFGVFGCWNGLLGKHPIVWKAVEGCSALCYVGHLT